MYKYAFLQEFPDCTLCILEFGWNYCLAKHCWNAWFKCPSWRNVLEFCVLWCSLHSLQWGWSKGIIYQDNFHYHLSVQMNIVFITMIYSGFFLIHSINLFKKIHSNLADSVLFCFYAMIMYFPGPDTVQIQCWSSNDLYSNEGWWGCICNSLCCWV